MQIHTLQDESGYFQVSVREAEEPTIVVLFAVGAGGDPERYVTLLDTLAETSCTVIAPHFQRLSSPIVTESDLALRAKRLSHSLNAFANSEAIAVGVGHSIGASTLLALAGGHMWLRSGQRAHIEVDDRLTKLALLAPPTGFFQAPGALCSVKIPILVWVGSADEITPPSQSEWLTQQMQSWQAVNLRVTNGAGHFSFMDNVPPNTIEPLQNKRQFLQEYSSEIRRFLYG